MTYLRAFILSVGAFLLGFAVAGIGTTVTVSMIAGGSVVIGALCVSSVLIAEYARRSTSE